MLLVARWARSTPFGSIIGLPRIRAISYSLLKAKHIEEG